MYLYNGRDSQDENYVSQKHNLASLPPLLTWNVVSLFHVNLDFISSEG